MELFIRRCFGVCDMYNNNYYYYVYFNIYFGGVDRYFYANMFDYDALRCFKGCNRTSTKATSSLKTLQPSPR